MDRYFRPTPGAQKTRDALQLLYGGLAVFLVLLPFCVMAGQWIYYACPVLFFFVAAVGSLQLYEFDQQYREAEPKPSDRDMDQWLAEDLSAAARRAMKRLDLTEDDLVINAGQVPPDESSEAPVQPANHLPPTVCGPVFDRTKTQRRGDDKVFRFRSYEVMVLCPTQDLLGIFECVLDARTGKFKKEELREVYYGDVRLISMVEKSQDLDFPWRDRYDEEPEYIRGKAKLYELHVVVNSRDRSEILAAANSRHAPGGKIRLQDSGIDNLVAELRNLLRVYK